MASAWLSTGFNPATLVGISFWTLGFYLICGGAIDRWIERTSQTIPLAIASLVSTLPFLLVGTIVEGLWEILTSPSWGISYSILTCAGLGIFRLGQLDNEAYQQKLKDRQEEERKHHKSGLGSQENLTTNDQ